MGRLVWIALLSGTVALAAGCKRDAPQIDEPFGAAIRSVERAQESPEVAPAKDPVKRHSVPEQPVNGELPKGYVRVKVSSAQGPSFGNAVLLYHAGSERIVPIYVGGTEGMSIGLRLSGKRFKRPLTHDLLDDVMNRTGSKLVRAQVDELRDGVYIGSIVLDRQGKLMTFDARPSDAIALAVGTSAPVFISEDVLEHAGVSVSNVEKTQPPRDINPVAL